MMMMMMTMMMMIAVSQVQKVRGRQTSEPSGLSQIREV